MVPPPPSPPVPSAAAVSDLVREPEAHPRSRPPATGRRRRGRELITDPKLERADGGYRSATALELEEELMACLDRHKSVSTLGGESLGSCVLSPAASPTPPSHTPLASKVIDAREAYHDDRRQQLRPSDLVGDGDVLFSVVGDDALKVEAEEYDRNQSHRRQPRPRQRQQRRQHPSDAHGDFDRDDEHDCSYTGCLIESDQHEYCDDGRFDAQDISCNIPPPEIFVAAPYNDHSSTHSAVNPFCVISSIVCLDANHHDEHRDEIIDCGSISIHSVNHQRRASSFSATTMMTLAFDEVRRDLHDYRLGEAARAEGNRSDHRRGGSTMLVLNRKEKSVIDGRWRRKNSDGVGDIPSDIFSSTGNIETITIRTLSLRMSDLIPDDSSNHFEVWLYTGLSEDDNGIIEVNENDIDDDPANNNLVVPSKGDYHSARANFSYWQLVGEGKESDLILDADFNDSSGHTFNPGVNARTGPLGDLVKNYNNTDEVNLAARQYNIKMLKGDGGMDAINNEGDVVTSYFYKIPEELFTPLKIPKYNGKLTLFVTLTRAALQCGSESEDESNETDVSAQDDVKNESLNLHVGEAVLVYPWMEDDAFYYRRRFLGKVWYDEQIPCNDNEYAPPVASEVFDVGKSNAHAVDEEDLSPMMSSRSERVVMADLLISVLLIEDRLLPPMPDDVKATLGRELLKFFDNGIRDFCFLTWNNVAKVTEQDARSIIIDESPDTGNTSPSTMESKKRERSGTRYLRRLLEPIFLASPNTARNQLLRSISILDFTMSFEAMYDAVSCPIETMEDFAILIEGLVNDNREDLLKRLKAASDFYFSNAFGVSADAFVGDYTSVDVDAQGKEDTSTTFAIARCILATSMLLFLCGCMTFLTVCHRHNRRKLEEVQASQLQVPYT
ncbi:hypothetical protein ACHAW5_005980 [Stephanodiscus triporus]|uniref:Uncharacterized protein n=1 Tax=Stephanodiscus triporus TaxID=2934178 RepID=A0ABD3NSJ4_9STRA